MKKRVCFLLIVMILLPVFLLPLDTNADTKYCHYAALGTINNFNCNLSLAQYDALKNGTISVVQKGKVFYYQFLTKNKKALWVNANAFMGGYKNDYTSVNKTLTSGLASTKSAKSTSYIYKKVKAGSWSSTTDIVKLYLYSSVSSSTLKFECSIADAPLSFSFNSISKRFPTFLDDKKGLPVGYCRVRTDTDYLGALRRNTKAEVEISPTFKVSLNNRGKKNLILKEYQYQTETKGYKNDTVKSVQQGIKVLSAFKTVAKTTTKLGIVENLYNLAKEFTGLFETENKFNLSKPHKLSCDGLSVLSAQFTSPFKLKVKNNYLYLLISLSDSFSSSKGAKISVTFSM